MAHLEALIIHEISKSLEYLERQGIGYIDRSTKDSILYFIDGKYIDVSVSDITDEFNNKTNCDNSEILDLPFA